VPRYVIVTGTDTGVGKTFVTAALARALAAREQRVLAVKPFESGAGDGDADGELLARATGQVAPAHALVRLREPLAPALAADRDGVVLDLDAIAAEIRVLSRDADVVLVEGAGGVLSPLTWDTDITTLAHRLDTDQIVLVAADRLGTLSATHCAAQVLLDTWLSPVAIVVSEPASGDASTGTNVAALRRRLPAPWAEAVIGLPRTDLATASRLLVELAARL
jgi:dethiobiotin synthetase